MNHIQKQIPSQYKNAEISCVFLYNKEDKLKINLFTIFELIPVEQEPSLLINASKASYLQRREVDKRYTLYVTRLINLEINHVLNLYENIEKGFSLKYDPLNADICLPYDLCQEPPNYQPLHISSNEQELVGAILPKRHTSFRVWSKLNTDKAWLKKLNIDYRRSLSEMSQGYFGYDLSLMQEHIGNIYLCASNPLFRRVNLSLTSNKTELLLSLHERKGKYAKGCKVRIEECRSKSMGFHLEHIISSTTEKIELPYRPDLLDFKLFDQSDILIEHHPGLIFIDGIRFNMGIVGTQVDFSEKTKKGIVHHKVNKTTKVKPVTVGAINSGIKVSHYLEEAVKKRKFKKLEDNMEFIFFPNEEDSKVRAEEVVRKLLNRAQKRCMILDPYFSVVDLTYIFTISNDSVPVKIISSGSFLRSEVKNDHSDKKTIWKKIIECLFQRWFRKNKTNAEYLLEGLSQYQKVYPQQKILCKVLRGKKSPLHDRFIIIDDNAYLLGSSLNEFGSRATTLIKVPTPKKMIEQAEAWWRDEEKCPDLKSYIEKKKSE